MYFYEFLVHWLQQDVASLCNGKLLILFLWSVQIFSLSFFMFARQHLIDSGDIGRTGKRLDAVTNLKLRLTVMCRLQNDCEALWRSL